MGGCSSNTSGKDPSIIPDPVPVQQLNATQQPPAAEENITVVKDDKEDKMSNKANESDVLQTEEAAIDTNVLKENLPPMARVPSGKGLFEQGGTPI